MNNDALNALITANPNAAAAAVLALAQADPRMANAIAASDLNPWLGNNGITPRLNRTADYIAALDVPTARTILAIDPSTPDASVPVIATLTADQLRAFTAYAGSGLPFAVDKPTVAGKVVKLLTVCQTLNTENPTLGVTADEAASLVALAGGYQVFDATLDQVTAAMAKRVRDAAYAALQAQADTINADAVSLYQQRTWKIQRLSAAGTDAPATLADLDGIS